jgi:hypothetical protein
MARDVMVTLDGQNYQVPALNIEQMEDVAEVLQGPPQKAGFSVLKIAMRRANPKPDFSNMSPTFDEIGNAVKCILELSGLQQPDANPQQETTPHLVRLNS